MTGSAHIPLAVAALAGAVGLAVAGGFVLREDPMENCHQIDPQDWAETVRSYDLRGLAPPPTAPMREIVLALEMPFTPDPEDVMLISVVPEARDTVHQVHDGPAARRMEVVARLAAGTEDAAEAYWLNAELIRPARLQTCGWAMEERFVLPAPPHPARWRVELLPGRVPTEDGGGSRTTRIMPLG